MEFIVVVLFFAVCATICMSCFVQANRISAESRDLNQGVLLAQSAAECIKTVEYAKLEEQLEQLVYPQAKKQGYRVEVEKTVKDHMLTAVILVKNEESDICKLTVKKYIAGEVR